MEQNLTEEQLKIKIAGEASNAMFRMKEEEMEANKEYQKFLKNMNIPCYVG